MTKTAGRTSQESCNALGTKIENADLWQDAVQTDVCSSCPLSLGNLSTQEMKTDTILL